MRVRSQEVATEGVLVGERIDFGIDTDSLQHLMSLMTRLYSDAETAVLREYATNAWDAHVEAGTTQPIQVRLPTPLDANLIIRDYGVGMSPDDVRNVFSLYGASTKRDTDDQTGMMGVGCKSALSYTNAFTFIAVKDGVRSVVWAGRSDDGSATMRMVDLSETDEPNGVEVQIPTAGHHEQLKSKALWLFSFWPSGTVELDGELNTCLTESDAVVMLDESTALVDLGLLNAGYSPLTRYGQHHLTRMDHQGTPIPIGRNGNGAHQDYVVMGGVPYPVDRSRASLHVNDDAPSGGIGDLRRGPRDRPYFFVTWMPMGSVTFTPSREALEYTPHTIDSIQSKAVEIDGLLARRAQEEVQSAESMTQAFYKLSHWYRRGMSRHQTVLWQGERIPHFHDFSNVFGQWFQLDPPRYRSKRDIDHDYSFSLVLQTWIRSVTHGFPINRSVTHQSPDNNQQQSPTSRAINNIFVVSDFPEGQQVSSRHRDKVAEYVRRYINWAPHNDKAYVTEEPASTFAHTPAVVVTWDEVKEAARQTSPSSRRAPASQNGTWPVRELEGDGVLRWNGEGDLRDTDNVYWYSIGGIGQDITRSNRRMMVERDTVAGGEKHAKMRDALVQALDVRLVRVPANRVTTFQREHPEVAELRASLPHLRREYLTSDGGDRALAVCYIYHFGALSRSYRTLAQSELADDLIDPDLQRLMRAIAGQPNSLRDEIPLIAAGIRCDDGNHIPAWDPVADLPQEERRVWDTLEERYSLSFVNSFQTIMFSSLDGNGHHPRILQALNAMYRCSTEEEGART